MKPAKGRGLDAALGAVETLLAGAERGIFIDRERRVRSTVLFPVAVVGVVIVVVLRPHVLRHAGQHAEHETKPAIERDALRNKLR